MHGANCARRRISNAGRYVIGKLKSVCKNCICSLNMPSVDFFDDVFWCWPHDAMLNYVAVILKKGLSSLMPHPGLAWSFSTRTFCQYCDTAMSSHHDCKPCFDNRSDSLSLILPCLSKRSSCEYVLNFFDGRIGSHSRGSTTFKPNRWIFLRVLIQSPL